MASKQSNVDFVLEQMADAGGVSARKMFGEYAIYCRGKVVALFCDDQLFMKATAAGRAFIGKVKEALPYPGAKAWYLIAGDRWEDADWLSELVRLTCAELPLPKPKAAKPKAKATRPKATKAKAKATKPKATKAKAKATKPKATKPNATKPKATKPNATKART